MIKKCHNDNDVLEQIIFRFYRNDAVSDVLIPWVCDNTDADIIYMLGEITFVYQDDSTAGDKFNYFTIYT